MPFEFLEDIATSDIAFEAWGKTVGEMFVSAADATVNVMIEDLTSIENRLIRAITVESDALDMLLFNLLQELIYYKDAEMLLLRVPKVEIAQQENRLNLRADAYGEEIDPERHRLSLDVKAVTLHRFEVREADDGWHATVILDV